MERKPGGYMNVEDLTPTSDRASVLVKVTWVGEPKEVRNRKTGAVKKVAEARVGDETGTIILHLRQEQIGSVKEGDVVFIDNGYISLVEGHMRLNIGESSKMTKLDQDIPNVKTEVDVSKAVDYKKKQQQRGGFRPHYGGESRGRGRRR